MSTANQDFLEWKQLLASTNPKMESHAPSIRVREERLFFGAAAASLQRATMNLDSRHVSPGTRLLKGNRTRRGRHFLTLMSETLALIEAGHVRADEVFTPGRI